MGTEAAVHSLRQWCERNAAVPGKVLLKLDFRNAFNSIDRGEVLRAVRERLPCLAPWVEFCYADPTRLFLDGAVLRSEEGVQQGVPLGPLLFALALLRFVPFRRRRRKCPAIALR